MAVGPRSPGAKEPANKLVMSSTISDIAWAVAST